MTVENLHGLRRRLLAGLVLCLGGPFATAAETGEVGAEAHDCIIEPFRVLEVGSAAIGVLEDVRVDRSDRVEAGEVIAVLESGVEAATVELARQRAGTNTEILAREVTYELNRSNKARSDRLHATHAIAVQTREEVTHDARLSALRLRQAREEKRIAELELVRARQSLARRTIRSPVDGVVMHRHKSPGERVEDQPVVRIAQLHPLRVEVVLTADHYGGVHDGMRARVTPRHVPGESFEARVTAIDPVLDAASGTFGVQLSMPNPDHAVPGGLRCTLEFLPEPTVAGNGPATPDTGTEPPRSDDTAPAVVETPAPEPTPAPAVVAKTDPAPTPAATVVTKDDRAPTPAPTVVAKTDPAPASAPTVVAKADPAPTSAPAVVAKADPEPPPAATVAAETEPASTSAPTAPAKTEPAAVASTPRRADPVHTVCLRLEGIEDRRQAAALRRAFETHGLSVTGGQERTRTAVGYMVAVDASDAGVGIDAIQATLRDAGIQDFQRLSRAPGRVSVGYFRGPDSAGTRADRVKAAGLPARIHPRTRELERWFLEVSGSSADLEDKALAAMLDRLAPGAPAGAACSGVLTASR